VLIKLQTTTYSLVYSPNYCITHVGDAKKCLVSKFCLILFKLARVTSLHITMTCANDDALPWIFNDALPFLRPQNPDRSASTPLLLTPPPHSSSLLLFTPPPQKSSPPPPFLHPPPPQKSGSIGTYITTVMCSISSLVSRKIPKRFLPTPTTPTRLINENKQCLAIPANMNYYIHKVWIWGILQSDWFSTSRILAHILLVEKNKMAAQTEFPTFANEKTASCSPFIAFSRLKTQWKRLANEFLKF
jgi:hypothetical protein